MPSMRLNRLNVFIIAILCIFLSGSAQASDFLFYKEVNGIGGYSRQKGWIGYSETLSNSVGFEHYGKFSNQYGDYLTTDLQVRGAYNANEKFRDAVSCEIHNAWAEYRFSPELKIRGGHFDPPFGLEPIVDTHATILQTLAMRDIGFKKDWGGSLRGSMKSFDYEAGFQIGSGMSIRRQDASFLASGRIGTTWTNNFQYGISAFVGRVLETMGMSTFPRNHLLSKDAIFKERIGFDCQYLWNSFLFKGEAAYGRNENKNVIGYMLEADYTVPQAQNWSVETQVMSFVNDMNKGRTDDSTFSMSLTYKLNQKVTLRAAFIQDLNMYSVKNKPRDTKFFLQIYYLGA